MENHLSFKRYRRIEAMDYEMYIINLYIYILYTYICIYISVYIEETHVSSTHIILNQKVHLQYS